MSRTSLFDQCSVVARVADKQRSTYYTQRTRFYHSFKHSAFYPAGMRLEAVRVRLIQEMPTHGMQWLISEPEFQNLIRNHKILRQDGRHLKVVLLPDTQVVKFFRLKAKLSSSLLFPRSFKFVRNAHKLKHMGVKSVEPSRTFFCPSRAVHGVIYPLLRGKPLENVMLTPEILEHLAVYIALLHSRGIYFRSLHLGNILLTEEGGFSLIDIADMKFYRFPLSCRQRVRNFRHLLRIPEHKRILFRIGMQPFLTAYQNASELSQNQQVRLRQSVCALQE